MTENKTERLRLIGDPGAAIYGLPIAEWQARNWGRAGVDKASGRIFARAEWVLSTGLARAIVTTPGAALVEAGPKGARLAAVHAPASADPAAIEAEMAKETADTAALKALGLKVGDAVALAGVYNKELRKRDKPFAIDIAADGIETAERALFKSSYKGVTDLVTKFAWPWPAFHVTRWCAAKGISPNTVTTVSLVFCLLAMWFFWRGDWALGFLTGWFMTFLDTVDGKLARTTLTSSQWGNIYDHGIDLIHPPFWYIAWYVGLGSGGAAVPDWALQSLYVILGLYVGGRIIEGIFMRVHGFHIHSWRRFDSVLRVVTARRNPNMLIFMLFTMVGAPAEGLLAVAVWTVLCNAIHLVRLVQAGVTPSKPPLESWMAS